MNRNLKLVGLILCLLKTHTAFSQRLSLDSVYVLIDKIPLFWPMALI